VCGTVSAALQLQMHALGSEAPSALVFNHGAGAAHPSAFSGHNSSSTDVLSLQTASYCPASIVWVLQGKAGRIMLLHMFIKVARDEASGISICRLTTAVARV
jgi:hypothetical protein